MSALSIEPTYPTFTDSDGSPLDDGYVWIGAAGSGDPIANPQTAYWDAALTQVVTQPVRTRGGYPLNAGAIGRLYVAGDYSIAVANRQGSVMYSAPNATERIGSELVTFLQAGTGAVTRTAQSKMREVVSVLDFGAVAYATQAEALTGTASNAAIVAAIASLPDTGGVIYFPGQYYRLDGTLRIEKNGVVFKGNGGGIQTGLLQTQNVDSVYVDNASGQPAPFGVEFHDLWFIGYKDRSVTPNTEGSAAALRIDDAYLCRISNCYFENGRFGIYLNNASDTFIENCFLEDQPNMLLMIGCTSIIANNLKFISCNSLNSLADSYAIRFNSATSKCEFNNINITGNSSLMAKGIELIGSRNQISNVYVEQGVTHGIVLTGATCSGNVVSNVAVYGSGNGLRLETSALNNTVSNIALSGNTTGLNVSSTTGAGNFYDNINAFSNTANAVVADAVAGTQRFVNASFQLVSGTTANRPGSGTGKTTGYMYFDTTINKPVWWLSPNWVDATGTVA